MLIIYNSLTEKKEIFIPIKKDIINIYVCGPTVYDHLHIGNIRSLIFFDMFKRYLKFLNLKVNLIVNITDIDDKIINKSVEKQKTEKEISSKYINHFFSLLTRFSINTINYFPLVTNHISDIILYIQKLIKTGYAYFTDYGIYFRVHLISNYGILSKQKINKLKKNVRKELDNQKENYEDFILWKKTDVGVQYSSPWFPGRPGWHTECVVMIKNFFRTTIDIHGGGNDLKFPHHENEQAQFWATDKKKLANFFIHIGNVEYNNQKMSKSLGNVILVKDLIKKIEPNVLKLLFLSYHFLQPINYNDDLINNFIKKYDKIVSILNKNNFQLLLNNIINSEKKYFYIKKFHSIMENNLNTPNIITLIEELLKEINKNKKDFFCLSKLQNTLIYILDNLGIKIHLKKISKKQIKIYFLWQQSKKKKKFQKADFLRNILKKDNII
ncbi:cysteine--tRNA ligase [Candidatus Phytoplasma oryzae]|uniref:Cysteine--tRNA ligase n=1 Tax=Candidatus Phytoplasma oryzae TaxID=203274 RepID=A0A139JQ35_9MOLU|nr:cysteine--tRNA ligase [Candidatus Phytoplasma oryzae]KXT29048.1 cysteine--tRNA ligase [Candidatus Phytoplasma oryzae]RAM57808.1 cysteinyl-tRNA synthetase [Candidatus Phytoplasma oryzae]